MFNKQIRDLEPGVAKKIQAGAGSIACLACTGTCLKNNIQVLLDLLFLKTINYFYQIILISIYLHSQQIKNIKLEGAEKTSNPSSLSCFPIYSQGKIFTSPSNNDYACTANRSRFTSVPLLAQSHINIV